MSTLNTELTLGSFNRRLSETTFGASSHVVAKPPKVEKGYKYVKVSVDGGPYQRKLDLEKYSSYHQLLVAMEKMFNCTICNVPNDMDISNGTKYLPLYEDKDGDWMLVGDIPWKMFVESCKRLRLSKHYLALD